MEIADILARRDQPGERGLHFICFNTHIGRQFEFIQHTWLNNPKFDGLAEDDDPMAAIVAGRARSPGAFTVQAEPVRTRDRHAALLHVRGGGYFFMPGIRAVRSSPRCRDRHECRGPGPGRTVARMGAAATSRDAGCRIDDPRRDQLFVPGGHENISHMVGQLGVPFADSMGWVVGAVECFGGLGILLGLLFPISVGLNVLNVSGLLVLEGLAGGIRTPCRAATLGVPRGPLDPGRDPVAVARRAGQVGAGHPPSLLNKLLNFAASLYDACSQTRQPLEKCEDTHETSGIRRKGGYRSRLRWRSGGRREAMLPRPPTSSSVTIRSVGRSRRRR